MSIQTNSLGRRFSAPSSGLSARHAQCLPVSTVVVQPGQLANQFFRKLDAFRIDLETARIDRTFTRSHVEITAGRGGEEDVAVFILYLFEAAETASVAELFPVVAQIIGIFHFPRIPKPLRNCQCIWLPDAAGFNLVTTGLIINHNWHVGCPAH